MKELISREEVYRIVGSAIQVHRELGAGFLEAVYHEALELQLKDDGVPFDSHPRLRLRYRQWTLKKGYQADFVCFGNIIVEIKAESRLTLIDQAQLINYRKATRLRTGVLINFGSVTRLEWKRFVY